MDALRNPKKISLLAVDILFLFTFFNLILDAPRIFNDLGVTEFDSIRISENEVLLKLQ